MKGNSMKRVNKYLYLYVVQGNYGYGWDDEAASEVHREALADLRAYRANGPGRYRLIQRREPNPDYKAPVTYNVMRFYESGAARRLIKRGLTLEAAQAHCQDPQTSSTTATAPEALQHTARMGRWFDGYGEARAG
jgi:hypothetical protein